jgi:hypothetical protein
MMVKTQPEFKLHFVGAVGSYFKELSSHSASNSETQKIGNDEIDLTYRRWIQLLDGADKITKKYKSDEGKVNIYDLAINEYKYSIEPCKDIVGYLHELSRKPKYKKEIENIPKSNDDIDGFSIPFQKKFFFKEGLGEEQKNFVIAHELSHFLLGHKGVIFYRSSSGRKKLYEKEDYNEEADKLAAFLLMPYEYIRKYKDKSDDELAGIFNVPPKAVEKRKKELETEINILNYTPASLRIQAKI